MLCRTTGYHHKSAIRMLRHPPKALRLRRGHKRTHGAYVARALKLAWVATDHIRCQRVELFLTRLAPILERRGGLVPSGPLRGQAMSASAATVDHLLAPYRRQGLRRTYTTSAASQ